MKRQTKSYFTGGPLGGSYISVDDDINVVRIPHKESVHLYVDVDFRNSLDGERVFQYKGTEHGAA